MYVFRLCERTNGFALCALPLALWADCVVGFWLWEKLVG